MVPPLSVMRGLAAFLFTRGEGRQWARRKSFISSMQGDKNRRVLNIYDSSFEQSDAIGMHLPTARPQGSSGKVARLKLSKVFRGKSVRVRTEYPRASLVLKQTGTSVASPVGDNFKDEKMKIIEAMKKVKDNREKIADLQEKISVNCAHLSIETPLYENASEKIEQWAQSCEDLSRDNVRLLTSISRTNLATDVAIEIDGKNVTKSIAEWIWRRREYAFIDQRTYSSMTDRGLTEGRASSSTGVDMDVKIVRKYDPEKRDNKVETYRSEPSRIDAALEVVNATTDLIEI